MRRVFLVKRNAVRRKGVDDSKVRTFAKEWRILSCLLMHTREREFLYKYSRNLEPNTDGAQL